MNDEVKKVRRKRLLKKGWKTFKEEKENPFKLTKEMIKGEEVLPKSNNNKLID